MTSPPRGATTPVDDPVGPSRQWYGRQHLPALAARYGFAPDVLVEMQAVAAVLPFRVSGHVLDHLIDWSAVPDDPIFRLVFPQPGMLEGPDLRRMTELIRRGASETELRAAADEVRARLNPHPDGQVELNAVLSDGSSPGGLQHKYRETVLCFPQGGQTCHAYCTYCFRWAQFIGDASVRFSEPDPGVLHRYLSAHPEVSDVLFTGGDPFVMRTGPLRRFVEVLLDERLGGLQTIRFGTKAISYEPARFLDGPEADGVLRLFEDIAASGRRAIVVAHLTHPRELESDAVEAAMRRILASGAAIYTQAPLVRGINDDAMTWRAMWTRQFRLGCVPYYMFVERMTGASSYFRIPLPRAYEIFRDAYAGLGGLARTVRGPAMSTTAGKVVIDGAWPAAGRWRFALRFVQGGDDAWVGRPFVAEGRGDETWFDQLQAASDEDRWAFAAMSKVRPPSG